MISRFDKIQVNIISGLFLKWILKFICKYLGPGIAKNSLKKEEVRGQILLDSKSYYAASVIQKNLCWSFDVKAVQLIKGMNRVQN